MAPNQRARTPAPDIDAASLAHAIKSGTAPLIVDTRSRWEYARAHIPGAVHLPFWRVGALHERLGARPDSEIVLYCGHGPRATWAQRTLAKLGYERVGLLVGHWQAWKELGS